MAQQMAATGNSPMPRHAATMPAIRATVPEMGDIVVCMILGKVITASVTYTYDDTMPVHQHPPS